MHALIDGDICAFRCAAVNEEADEESALLVLDRQIQEILYVTESDKYNIYLTGKNNFRKEIYPEYKANRKDKPKPKWLESCRNYLINNWNAEVSEGCEADDLLGVHQTDTTLICSIDKDLHQIPGRHYNFVKNEFKDVTLDEGIKFFYHQLLKGDTSDNIPGVEGIGEKKAQKLLKDLEDEQEMFDLVRRMYTDDEVFLTYGKCLWIWREMNGIWNPTELLTGDNQSSYEVVGN